MQLYPDIKTKYHAHLIVFVTSIAQYAFQIMLPLFLSQSVPLLNMFFLYINYFTDSVACDSIQHGV